MHRREFLTWSAAAAIGSMCSAASVAAPPRRQWCLAPEPGLFETDTVASAADQLRFAADFGFRAFVDDGWLARSQPEQSEFAAVARNTGILWGPFRGPALTYNLWDEWVSELNAAFDAAEALGTRSVRVEIPVDRLQPPFHVKREAGRDSLKIACDAAAKRSLTLFLEPWTSRCEAEGDVLDRFANVVATRHPTLQLSVDVYQLSASGLDAVGWLERYLPWIGHIELADFPGGLEPGTGRLDVPRICALLDQYCYDGFVGLRHGRSLPGRAGIEAVLQACQRIEPSIKV